MFDTNWLPIKDGDARGLALMRRHYSWHEYRDNRPRHLFVGPGQKMVLLTPGGDALFVWRKFIDASGQVGVNCSAFRNEGPLRSSDLIREACAIAWLRWPGERLYTYIDSQKVASGLPGYCYRRAGWRWAHDADGHWLRTGSGKLVMERLA